jgi:hypothetical protein
MFTFTATSCGKEPSVPIPSQSDTLQPTQNTAYPLTGIKWKLVEFVSVSDGTTKTPEQPLSDNCYWITFQNDSVFIGRTSTNDIYGNYEVNTQDSTIRIIYLLTTEVNELFDGPFYSDCLRMLRLSACSFEVTETSLKLYYNETDYLLFNAYDYETK